MDLSSLGSLGGGSGGGGKTASSQAESTTSFGDRNTAAALDSNLVYLLAGLAALLVLVFAVRK